MAKAKKVSTEPLVEIETTETMQGHTVFSFVHPTPMWATWVFRTEFILNKALLFWMSGTTVIPTAQAKEYILIAGAIDLVVWFFARSLGVKKEDIEKDA